MGAIKTSQKHGCSGHGLLGRDEPAYNHEEIRWRLLMQINI